MVRVVYRYPFTDNGANIIPAAMRGSSGLVGNIAGTERSKLGLDSQIFTIERDNTVVTLVRWESETANSLVLGYFVVPAGEGLPECFADIKSDLHILSPRAALVQQNDAIRLTKRYTIREQKHPIQTEKNIFVVDDITGFEFDRGDRIVFFLIPRGWDSSVGARTGLEPNDYQNGGQQSRYPYLFSQPSLNPDFLGKDDSTQAGVHFLQSDGILVPYGIPIKIVRCEDTPTDWNSDRDFNDFVFYLIPKSGN